MSSELRQRPGVVPAPSEEQAVVEQDEMKTAVELVKRIVKRKFRDKMFFYQFSFLIVTVFLITLACLGLVGRLLAVPSDTSVEPYLGAKDQTPIYISTEARDADSEEYQMRRYRLNKRVSDSLPLNRDLTDYRPHTCKFRKYDTVLSKLSVIVILRTAPPSVILRLIHSVLDRTKHNLIAEIILYSHGARPALQHHLSSLPYVQHHVSSMKRTLTSARNEAANLATGDVIVFLPEATEILPGWADPLLQHIKDKPKSLVGLSMDQINPNTFEQEEHVPWHLLSFPRWDFVSGVAMEIPKHEDDRRHREDLYPDSAAVRTPAIQFQPFAAPRKMFMKLGGLDSGLVGDTDIVVGELIELSLRWWACGGEVYYLPCSKVALVSLLEAQIDSQVQNDELAINSRRIAARWSGPQYDKHYFERVPAAKYMQASRSDKLDAVLLQCKDLTWYKMHVALDWVFPEAILKHGAIQHAYTSPTWCVDKMGHEGYTSGAPGYYTCNAANSQYWLMTKANGQIKTETGKCLKEDDVTPGQVTMDYCPSAGHAWYWTLTTGDIGTLQYKGKCLELSPQILYLKPCTGGDNQQWKFGSPVS